MVTLWKTQRYLRKTRRSVELHEQMERAELMQEVALNLARVNYMLSRFHVDSYYYCKREVSRLGEINKTDRRLLSTFIESERTLRPVRVFVEEGGMLIEYKRWWYD